MIIKTASELCLYDFPEWMPIRLYGWKPKEPKHSLPSNDAGADINICACIILCCNTVQVLWLCIGISNSKSQYFNLSLGNIIWMPMRCLSAESHKNLRCQKSYSAHWLVIEKPVEPPEGHRRTESFWASRDDQGDWSEAPATAIDCEWNLVLQPDERWRDMKGTPRHNAAEPRKAPLVWQQGESQRTAFNAHRNRSTEAWLKFLPAQSQPAIAKQTEHQQLPVFSVLLSASCYWQCRSNTTGQVLKEPHFQRFLVLSEDTDLFDLSQIDSMQPTE